MHQRKYGVRQGFSCVEYCSSRLNLKRRNAIAPKKGETKFVAIDSVRFDSIRFGFGPVLKGWRLTRKVSSFATVLSCLVLFGYGRYLSFG